MTSDQAGKQYAPFTQLPPLAGLGGTDASAIQLPATPADVKSSVQQEVEPLFQMARKVIEDHDRWISAAQDEEVNRKERQELLRVAAEIPQDTQVTMHFQLPTGSKVTEKMQPTQTSYEIYTKAFQLLQQEREFRIKVEGAEGEHFSKDVNEANFHLSLESLGLKPGCSYTVIVS
ncbi:unnamed protein product [Cladocopium goreaui]|uniref:PAS domain-containing protein n=1 Tax=Cladocopium goreaui TaxID=2562237 RepID=A0A9P1BQX2_9DINO|nr:unnamed protein product [Cladocopium goreaui]|mmetsp:Transcript_52136/g.113715  ORF Transcript_52136/g.113715 Transcript_52136/m.113715 type:complete len:175 (-) Transcript_52136:98-622(-)